MATLIPPSDDLGLGEGYHSPQMDVKVRLNTNESPLPPPAEWVEDVAAAVGRIDHNRYPDRGYVALRAALAASHGVDAREVFVANGSNEVLQTLLLAYGGPTRAVGLFEPTYALHGHIARLTRTRVIVGERDADFGIPEIELDRVTGQSPALTFLCSPNNPTGRAEPRLVVERALAMAPGMVVVDEAYGQFAPWSALELFDGETPLLVVRTFSKTWSMAATRLGYLIAPAPVVAHLDQVVLPYHLDSLKQEAGRLALAHRGEMEDRVKLIVSERERVAAELAALAARVWPSDASFILFQPGGDARVVWQALVDQGVLVRDCSSWPRLSGCLRVTIGTPDENDAFLAALKETLA